MTTEAKRCANCGISLTDTDEVCPACGAPVDADTNFPEPEEFVHESYQNIDPPEPEVDTTPAYADTPEPVVIQTRPDTSGGEPFAASPPVYSTGGGQTTSSTGRTCAIACGVILILVLCCLLSFALVAWFAGDLVIDILREFGIFI